MPKAWPVLVAQRSQRFCTVAPITRRIAVHKSGKRVGGHMDRLLMATCPQCRTEMSTGISADEQTMHELGPKLQVLVLCDNCREYQRMMVQDLYFAPVLDAVAA